MYIYFVVFSLWQCVVYDSNFDLHLQLQYSKGKHHDDLYPGGGGGGGGGVPSIFLHMEARASTLHPQKISGI